MTYLSQLLTENLLIVCSYILASEEHDASLADYTGISRCSASIRLTEHCQVSDEVVGLGQLEQLRQLQLRGELLSDHRGRFMMGVLIQQVVAGQGQSGSSEVERAYSACGGFSGGNSGSGRHFGCLKSQYLCERAFCAASYMLHDPLTPSSIIHRDPTVWQIYAECFGKS